MRIDPRSFLLVGLTATAVCQNDYDLDRVTSGMLGAPTTLQVQNAPPNMVQIVAMSLSGGPTPIMLVDGNDPRSLELGVELFNDWIITFTSPTGTAGVSLLLPSQPAFEGLFVHWQAFTFPGTTTIIDRISNDVATKLGSSGVASLLPTVLANGRAFALSSLHQAGGIGGEVLVCGGGSGSLTAAVGTATCELFDARELSVHAGPSMSNSRALHTGTELLDGRLLVVGGVDALGNVLSSCEIYDPVAHTWTATGGMGTARVLHSAVRMADGRVLVAGGTASLATQSAAVLAVLASAEIYNPTTGTWSAAAALGGNRLSPSLTLLPNNRVMAAGGLQVNFLFGFPTSAGTTNAVQFYDATLNSWSAGPAMPGARAGHHTSQVRLNDGRILLSGGISASVNLLTQVISTSSLASADAYNPATNTWGTSTMPTARTLHTATVLPSGRVVACGGAQGTLDAPVPVANVDQFDPATNTWSALAPLTAPRSAHVAALLPDGLLVLLGGQDTANTLASIETLHF